MIEMCCASTAGSHLLGIFDKGESTRRWDACRRALLGLRRFRALSAG